MCFIDTTTVFGRMGPEHEDVITPYNVSRFSYTVQHIQNLRYTIPVDHKETSLERRAHNTESLAGNFQPKAFWIVFYVMYFL